MKYTKERPTEPGQWYWFRSDHTSPTHCQMRNAIILKVIAYDHAPDRRYASFNLRHHDVNEMGGEFAGPLPEPEGSDG